MIFLYFLCRLLWFSLFCNIDLSINLRMLIKSLYVCVCVLEFCISVFYVLIIVISWFDWRYSSYVYCDFLIWLTIFISMFSIPKVLLRFISNICYLLMCLCILESCSSVFIYVCNILELCCSLQIACDWYLYMYWLLWYHDLI